MRPLRTSLGASVLPACVTGFTTWITMGSWRGFSEAWAAYLGPLFIGAGLIALTGAGLRWLRVNGLLVFGAQFLVALLLFNLTVTGSPIPLGSHFTELESAVRHAIESSQEFASPVPLSAPGIEPLMIPLGLAFLLLVDFVACGLRRVPLSGLVLLIVYSIPVGLLLHGVSWLGFALSATGFMAMLFLHEQDEVARWGRPLETADNATDSAAFGVRTGAVRGTALAVGGVATALAIVLPSLIPTLDLAWFGTGPGEGDGKVTVTNPMTDLRHDLRRGADSPLLRISTDDPRPAYLRLAVLTSFTNNEWRAGDRNIPSDQVAKGELPALPGVNPGTPRKSFDYVVSIYRNFESRWLPTMPLVERVDAPGDWRYDTRTMDFLAANDDTRSAELSYSMTAARLNYSTQTLLGAGAASSALQATYTRLPSDLPAEIERVTREITADQPTKYQKAVALQNFFRRDGGFRYDLSAKAGNGAETLVAFLDPANGRAGYCEQFASAMAVMARAVNIPARVAVGFYQPDRLAGQTFEYSAHDLHAWPELYFPGSGWVIFEPTPSAHIPRVPGYTRIDLAQVGDPATDVASSRSTADTLSRGASERADSGAQAQDAAGRGGSRARAVIWWLSGLLALTALVALALMVPRLVRRHRRERRWATLPAAEAAWGELHDTMVDLGQPWPSGRSPRTTALHIADCFGAPLDRDTPARPRRGPDMAPEAAAALDRIVHEVEVLRYAPPASHGQVPLHAEVETCVAALEGGATAAQRRQAHWLPGSVLQSRRRRDPLLSRVENVGVDGVVDHVG